MVQKSAKETQLPVFKKQLYTKEIIDFILELIKSEKKDKCEPILKKETLTQFDVLKLSELVNNKQKNAPGSINNTKAIIEKVFKKS